MNHHGAADKRSSEQQFCKSNVIAFAVQKFWSQTPITTRSYSRLADKMWMNFAFLKLIIDRVFKHFAAFNKVTALLEVAVRSAKIGESIFFLVDLYLMNY